MRFEDIPIHSLGNQIEIAGVIMQGQGKTYAILFPDADNHEIDAIPMSHDEWKKFLLQVDTLEVVLFPNSKEPKLSKTVVRKSQRNIEQHISWNVFRRDNYTCRYCGINNVPLTVDHIILWEDLGPSVEENLICACRKCNKMRGNTDYLDWLASDFYKEKSKFLSEKIKEENMFAWDIAKVLPLRSQQRNR